MYADGALDDEQANTTQRHLANCDTCNKLVADFIAQGASLRSALRSADVLDVIPEFTPRPTISTLLTWLGWTALTAWGVNTIWMTLPGIEATPQWLGWLAPDPATMAIDFTVGVISWLLAPGAGVWINAVQSAIWLTVIVLCLASVGWLVRDKIRPNSTLCLGVTIVAVLLTTPLTGHAFEVRSDDHRVTIPANETIDDTLVVRAENVLVEGNITGDLIVLGEQVNVRGHVSGSLLTIAKVINIEGEVNGNILSIGETSDIRNLTLGANLYSVGRTITVQVDTQVGGNALFVANESQMHGSVSQDLLALNKHFSLIGSVDGDVRAYGEQVDLSSSARIGANLNAKVKTTDHLRVDSGATIVGETIVSSWPEQPSKYATFEYYLGEVAKLVSALIAGLVLFYLFPALSRTRLDNGTQLLTVAGIGAVALVATPVLAVIVTLTLIGAPLGILTLMFWFATLYMAGIVIAGHIGRLLLNDETNHPAWSLLTGLTVLVVLINVPVLGGIVRLIAIVVGFGLITQLLHHWWSTRLA